jgi:4-carboxymuconolactone decarboxylase
MTKKTDNEFLEENERFERGHALLNKIHGSTGKNVLEGISELSPDLSKFITEYAFGDIYCREALGLRERQIATIASLITLGGAETELKVHMKAGLNVGLSKEEIIEIILQMSLYAGFPRAIHAIKIAKEVFDELNK